MQGFRDRYTASQAAPRKSLRSSLVLLVLVPVLALTGLWGYAATTLVTDGLEARSDAELAASAGRPALDVLAGLQEERRRTAVWQAAPRGGSRSGLDDARSRTDTAIEEFRTVQAELEAGGEAVRQGTEDLGKALDELAAQRDAIDDRTLNRDQTFQFYTDTLADGTGLLDAATRTEDGRIAHGADGLTSLAELSELLSREDALLSGALASGSMPAAARSEFGRHLAVQRQIRTSLAAEDLPREQAAGYQRLLDGERWTELVSYEDTVTTGPKKLPEQSAWRETADALGKDLRKLGSATLEKVADDATARANGLLIAAGLGTLVAVAALAATITLARRFSGALFGRLARLHRTTTELTETGIPQFVEQLGRGERVDPGEQPRDADHANDEVGRLAAATDRLGLAVRATLLQQDRGREGTEQVFLGLARRTQVLIGRLIPKLDELERKHQDSELLKDIFAVDHLATRVRRHTENLVILGGSPPVRRWNRAVPIYEVLRSAISETEDYRRVDAQPAPQVSLVGPAVADVVHLLAELIENGTAFSPPDTKVSVTATKVAKGLALEVEDRGLGMPEDRYAHLNRMLAEPPKLDMLTLGETPRLGLFVVARLARRHNLEISLRRSPYGGTLAIVLLPTGLLEETKSLLSSILPEQQQQREQEQGQGRDENRDEARDYAPGGHTVLTGADAEAVTDALGGAQPHRAYPSPAIDPAPAPAAPAAELAPQQQPQRAYATAGVGAGGDTTTVLPASFDDNGGFPSYGGAGLLPSTPSGPGAPSGPSTPSGPNGPETRAEDSPAFAGRARPHRDAHADAGYTTPAGNEMSQDPPAQVTTAGTLPTRVRGESLAEPLRRAANNPSEQDTSSGMPSPERAGAAIAAIQAANRRVRGSGPDASAGGHDPQAESPGHGVRPEDH